MTRRESVRVILFARGTLIGADRSLRCAVINLSGAGAMLTLTADLPTPPLRLKLTVGEDMLELPVEIQRTAPGAGVAVTFPRPHSERLYRAIAAEQRRALAQGRVNISERRAPGSGRTQRGDEVERRDKSGS